MTTSNQMVGRVVRVLRGLGMPDFSPKSLHVLHESTDLPVTTVWRILKGLEHHGWVVHDEARKLWSLGKEVAEFAYAYKRGALARIQSIEEQYRHVTGEDLTP